ncbi:hypothetical protein PRVXH_001276 [Proteinivorax hydrogeniformans]|uniref:Uncharacterized protein n=1 Tax=Proteinivorax hydrogeniformans TaxID=1826727 RepID=A0AAU8HX45_9FIRM
MSTHQQMANHNDNDQQNQPQSPLPIPLCLPWQVTLSVLGMRIPIL